MAGHVAGIPNADGGLWPYEGADYYRLPDHPDLLQFYVWQEYDLAPAFPELRGLTTGQGNWRAPPFGAGSP
jgi:hypothetical protein